VFILFVAFVYLLGSNADIKSFATSKFHVTFPMFAKVDVKGANAHPLFVYLEENASSGLLGASIKWNFEKFLCDKKGMP
jgi:glutathione peroxidase